MSQRNTSVAPDVSTEDARSGKTRRSDSLPARILSSLGKDDLHKPGNHWKSRKALSGVAKRWTRPWFWKWFFPWAFGGFGFYVQSSLLHYATYRYVHQIDKERAHMIKTNWELFGRDVYQRLEDPLAEMFGKQVAVNLKILDSVAAFFPATFMAISLYCGAFTSDQILSSQCLQVWTKVFTCAGLLFILKGSLGAMTTVPDSSGWQVCKDRLEPEGIAYMREEHTLWEMFRLDYHWHFAMHNPHPLRYCSDMMYSGHTFVVTLFALAFYEMVGVVWKEEHKHTPLGKDVIEVKQSQDQSRKRTLSAVEKDSPADKLQNAVAQQKYNLQRKQSTAWKHESSSASTHKAGLKAVFLTIWALFAIGEQMIEIYLVLLSRFHYSMDVVMALVVTFLLYTNGAVAVFAKQWELRGVNLLIPRFVGQLFPSYGNVHYPTVKDDSDQTLDPPSRSEWQSTEMWSTRGDIYVPVCCFPFCCLAGRQHIYSDNDMRSIGYCLSTLEGNPCKMDFQDLQAEWNLDEGVSGQDVADMFKMCAGIDPAKDKNKALSDSALGMSTGGSHARELSGLQEPLVGSEAV